MIEVTPARGAGALDPDAQRYAAWWEPVLAAPARHLLERVASDPGVYLDIGSGSGGLVLAAAARWPRARVLALDASAAMLSLARHRVASAWSADAHRFTWLVADATAMPLDDASVDLVTATFVLGLVDDRAATLHEIRRVLRPGGTLALVDWAGGEAQLAADPVFRDVLARFGLDDGSTLAADPATVLDAGELATELMAAGLVDVDVRGETLEHRWSRDGFLDFKRRFEEQALFEMLDRPTRRRLTAELRADWAALPDDAFRLHAALVSALARRPRGEAPGGRPPQAAKGVPSSGRQTLQGR